MDDRTLRSLLQRLDDIERQQVKHRLGVVTATSPLSVALGGSSTAYTNVRAVGGGLEVDDVVSCITFGNDLLVLGKVSEIGGARPLATYHQEGESEAYAVFNSGDSVTVNAARSKNLEWVYTPEVDAWAEITMQIGIVYQPTAAAWYYAQLQQRVTGAVAFGAISAWATTTCHNAAPYGFLSTTRKYPLVAGTTYTFWGQFSAQSNGVFQFYQGAGHLWMEGKAWAR